MQRGSAVCTLDLNHHVLAVIGNFSCGMHAFHAAVRRGVKSEEFEYYSKMFRLQSDNAFQRQLNDFISCVDSANEDLHAGAVRMLFCEYGLRVVQSNPESDPFRELLLRYWDSPPDDELYNGGEEIARRAGIDTDFQRLDSRIQVACKHAVCILSPEFYFDCSTALLLQQYLLNKIAIVVIIDNGKRKSDGLGKAKGNPRETHHRFTHSRLCDFVHPSESVFWFPMLQRERHGVRNHYELLLPPNGCCPMQPIPSAVEDLNKSKAPLDA